MNNWNGILSLLFASIEFILLINLLVFAEKNRLNLYAVMLIFLLFAYQLFEFLICGLNMTNPVTIYTAFVIISFLPPLTQYMVLHILGFNDKKLSLLFLPALFFVVFYAFMIPSFRSTHCTPFYVSYNYPLGSVYGFFYYVPVFISAVMLYGKIKKNSAGESRHEKVLFAGITFTMLPAVIAFLMLFAGKEQLINIIESVMCKFAFVYALCLSFFSLNNKSVEN